MKKASALKIDRLVLAAWLRERKFLPSEKRLMRSRVSNELFPGSGQNTSNPSSSGNHCTRMTLPFCSK